MFSLTFLPKYNLLLIKNSNEASQSIHISTWKTSYRWLPQHTY